MTCVFKSEKISPSCPDCGNWGRIKFIGWAHYLNDKRDMAGREHDSRYRMLTVGDWQKYREFHCLECHETAQLMRAITGVEPVG